jgi:hypothetical protein
LDDHELATDEAIKELRNTISSDSASYMKLCGDMAELKRQVELIEQMKTAAAKIIKRDFQEFWMGKERSSNLASVGSRPAPAPEERPTSGMRPSELKLTGDPQADEKIRKFAEYRAAFHKKAEEARMSQTLT